MKKSELKKLINEIVHESFFGRGKEQPSKLPDHRDTVKEALKDPVILALRNKYMSAIGEDEMNDVVGVVYGIAKYGRMDSHYLEMKEAGVKENHYASQHPEEFEKGGTPYKALGHQAPSVPPQPIKSSSKIQVNGKSIDKNSIELEDVDGNDYPDFSDAYISSATFEDGIPLSEEELEELNNKYPELVNDMAQEYLHENGSR